NAPLWHRGEGSNGRRIGSGSFSADRSVRGGGADVTGGFGAGDGGAKRARRGGQADRTRTRGGSQDGQALAEARQLAAAAKPASTPAARSLRRVHRATRAGGRVERCGSAPGAGGPWVYRELSAGAALA